MIMNKNTLENYDIKLTRLSRDKIEMVRNWRNDPNISRYMLFRDYITQEMQQQWFDSINNEKNLYYIVEYKTNEIGLINVKDIDYDEGIGEGGIFIADEAFQNTDIAYRAHILLFDYVFEEFGLSAIISEILESNKRAIRFAEFLGSKQTMKTDGRLLFKLERDDYFSNRNRKRFLKRWDFYNNSI